MVHGVFLSASFEHRKMVPYARSSYSQNSKRTASCFSTAPTQKDKILVFDGFFELSVAMDNLYKLLCSYQYLE